MRLIGSILLVFRFHTVLSPFITGRQTCFMAATLYRQGKSNKKLSSLLLFNFNFYVDTFFYFLDLVINKRRIF